MFLQKDLTTGDLVCWKDQQNFAPFIDGVPPDTSQYTQALRYFADPNEFPLFPVYTADQADQAADVACSACSQGTNNFSNINETLQARLFSKAIRDYPSPYITPLMYRQMITWQAWNEYVNGNNQFPDNNEFYFDWDPTTQTLGRSSIPHDTLGSFNWVMYQDVAGLQPRMDNQLELWPIDMGYDHFAIDNISYHGVNLTIVWQQPGGTRYYAKAPFGYSAYVNGRLAFTIDRLAHVIWNPQNGRVQVLDGSHARVTASAHGDLAAASQVSLSGNARIVDAFQKAGLNLRDPNVPDLALGKTATASFTTTTPASLATDPANAVDGFTISGSPVVQGSYIGLNPIWGDQGSPNAQDWLQVDLGKQAHFDDVKVYFYDNKAFGVSGSTYRPPASYTVQYFNGSSWVDVPDATEDPSTAAPNLNEVSFPTVRASQVRVLMTLATGFAVGVKEIQVFDMPRGRRLIVGNGRRSRASRSVWASPFADFDGNRDRAS